MWLFWWNFFRVCPVQKKRVPVHFWYSISTVHFLLSLQICNSLSALSWYSSRTLASYMKYARWMHWCIHLAYFTPCKVLQKCKSVRSMQQSEMTLMLTTRTPAMDYLSIWLHNRIIELEDKLPCKPGKTSGVCVHLNPIYVFNGLRRGVRDRALPGP